MPFVMMCGFPSSGKTTRSNELKKYMEDVKGVRTTIVSDHRQDVHKNMVYKDSSKEKDLRSTLKSETQRLINKDAVLILDSPNYIKGYRYELYCASKSAQTPHCVIHCASDATQAWLWNSSRPVAECYEREVFDGLVMRFEAPDDRNRWDSPVFTVIPSDVLPCDQIYDALFHRKAPPPNLSTQSQPLSATNFLHELDTITQGVVMAIIEQEKTAVPGDCLTIPGSAEKMELSRIIALAELQRLRRQFVVFTKTLAIDDTTKLAGLFVQFLNNRI